MKKYIKDMTTDELRDIWNANRKLRETVWNDAMEYVTFWQSEYLHSLDACAASYDIGYSGAYMIVKNEKLFLEWIISTNKDFGLFWDLEKDSPGNVKKLAEKGIMLLDKMEYEWDILSEENYTRIEKRLHEIVEIFVDEFLRICREEYDFFDNDENLFNFWADENQLYNWYDCFVDDDLTPGVLRRVETITTVFA